MCSLPQVGSDDVAKWMVQQGEAVAYREYSTAYVEDEDVARKALRGLWGGTFEAPKDWRKENKAALNNSKSSSPTSSSWSSLNPSSFSSSALIPEDNLPPKDCYIKGNISASGEKIYHVPKVRRPCV
jgi:hypothetical protein